VTSEQIAKFGASKSTFSNLLHTIDGLALKIHGSIAVSFNDAHAPPKHIVGAPCGPIEALRAPD
jgi:hypothetical protein